MGHLISFTYALLMGITMAYRTALGIPIQDIDRVTTITLNERKTPRNRHQRRAQLKRK